MARRAGSTPYLRADLFEVKNFYFFFFPPDLLPPEDLDAEDFLEPPPAFFAEEDLPFPPFLAFSVGGLPPPDGAVPLLEGWGAGTVSDGLGDGSGVGSGVGGGSVTSTLTFALTVV